MFALFLLFWSLVGGQVTIHQQDGAVRFTDLYGSAREAEGATSCLEGRPVMWISAQASIDTLVHELAHAYDCVDNGVMDASPTERPARRPVWVSDYCWADDIEWYACSVVQYRRIAPHTHPHWGRDHAGRPSAWRR
jgi:hypothetical protein